LVSKKRSLSRILGWPGVVSFPIVNIGLGGLTSSRFNLSRGATRQRWAAGDAAFGWVVSRLSGVSLPRAFVAEEFSPESESEITSLSLLKLSGF
jgi:hypothetical protein